jgi:opacity protein-like surface antigen
MKKILAILAMATITSGAFAASATIEYQNIDGVKTTPQDQRNVNLTIRENITKSFVGDVQLSDTANKGSADTASSFRAEAGLTGLYDLGPATLYTRGAVGEKYTTSANFAYYSVEPGVIVPFGSTGVSAKVGYRFRNAFNDVNTNNDTTRTWRAGLSYDITKKDTVGVRYDQVRGDSKQNIWAFAYTRGF